jgi:methionyl aminopeptidase
MRIASQIVADTLELVKPLVQPGVTTDDLDRVAHEYIVLQGAYPSPLRYAGFPKAVCTSVNDVIVHGIPDLRPLEDGDVISVDVSCYIVGVHGDSCRTFLVGDKAREDTALVALVDAAARCLRESIRSIGPGAPVTRIGEVVQEICDETGYGTVPNFFGHGVGEHFHTHPLVRHYANNDTTYRLEPGLCFTIEPMIVETDDTALAILSDGWTAVSVHGHRSAQFEHTLLVTEDGIDVLTAYPDWESKPF